VQVTGLCRTDLKIVRVGHRDLVLAARSGRGSRRRDRGSRRRGFAFSHGQRVYIYPGTSCGTCDACRRGAGNLCASMQIMGFHRDGGFAEYVCAPQASLIPIPDGLPDDVAILAEPLSCCLNALERAALKPGDCVGVWGRAGRYADPASRCSQRRNGLDGRTACRAPGTHWRFRGSTGRRLRRRGRRRRRRSCLSAGLQEPAPARLPRPVFRPLPGDRLPAARLQRDALPRTSASPVPTAAPSNTA
jgi:hypothetical protein